MPAPNRSPRAIVGQAAVEHEVSTIAIDDRKGGPRVSSRAAAVSLRTAVAAVIAVLVWLTSIAALAG
jgi:hypothetical protein